MSRLAGALHEVDPTTALDELPPFHTRGVLKHSRYAEDVVHVPVRGRAAWSHTRGSGTGFLNAGPSPTSLLARSLAAAPEAFSSGASHSPGANPSTASHQILEALAMPLAAHAAFGLSGVNELKELSLTSFINEGPAFGECQNHYEADDATRFHDYQLDIKPFSVKRLARQAFAGVTAIAEHLGLMNAHVLTALALLAIWSLPPKLSAIKLPSLKMIGLANPLAGVSLGFASIGNPFKAMASAAESAGRGLKMGFKGIGKGFKIAGKGMLKLGKFVGKGIGKLAVGLALGAAFLGKGLVKIVKFTGKMAWKGLQVAGKGLVAGAELLGKAVKFGAKKLWAGTKLAAKGLVAGAKLAWKGAKFAAKMLGRGAALAWKGVKATAKVAWKGAKMLGKGIAKVASLAWKGLGSLYDLIDHGIKNGARGLLSAGKFIGNNAGTAAALAGGALLLGGVALLAMHAMRKKKGASRASFGRATKLRGKEGRHAGGGARQRAMDAAARAAAARKEKEKKKKQQQQQLDQEPVMMPKKKRLVNHVPPPPSSKKQSSNPLDDLMGDHRNAMNALHEQPTGKQALAATLAAGAGGALMGHQMSKKGNTLDHVPGTEETLENNPPGPVVVGHRRDRREHEDTGIPASEEREMAQWQSKRNQERFERHRPGPPPVEKDEDGHQKWESGYKPHHPPQQPPPPKPEEQQVQENAEEEADIKEKMEENAEIEKGKEPETDIEGNSIHEENAEIEKGQEPETDIEGKVDEQGNLGQSGSNFVFEGLKEDADHFAGQDVHGLSGKLAADKRAMDLEANRLDAGKQFAELAAGRSEIGKAETQQRYRQHAEVYAERDDAGDMYGRRVTIGPTVPMPPVRNPRLGKVGPSSPGAPHGLNLQGGPTESPEWKTETKVEVRRLENQGTPKFPIYRARASEHELEALNQQELYHIKDESDEYRGLVKETPQSMPESPSPSSSSCVSNTGAFRRACGGRAEGVKLIAERDAAHSAREAQSHPEGGIRHKQFLDLERANQLEQNERENSLPPNKRPLRQQEAFPEVGANRRMHRAGSMQFSDVRNMDTDEFEYFKARADLHGNPRDVTTGSSDVTTGHGKKHRGHVVSSSLQTQPAPQAFRVARRASAFLQAASGQSQDFPSVPAEVCSDSLDTYIGDEALFPLYYLDSTGEAREFLDPALLKPAYRKFAVGVRTVGSLFLATPVQEEQLRCKSPECVD